MLVREFADRKLRSHEKRELTNSNALSAGRRGLCRAISTCPPSHPSRLPSRGRRGDRPAASAWLMSAGGGRGNPVVGVIPASDGRCRRRGEPRLQRPPGVARSHRRRCADAWGVGEGMCDGVGATRCCCGEDGGCCVIVNTCFYDDGRSLCRWIDFQNTEVD